MNNNQLALIRAIIEHASIVEVDNAETGHYECNERGEPFTKYMNDEEFKEVREYLAKLVSSMPTSIDS